MSSQSTVKSIPCGASGRQSFLVVFDFDDTVVNCNSDSVVPEYLGRLQHQKYLMKRMGKDLQWTDLCDSVLAPFTRAQIEEAVVKSIKMDEDMPDVFRFLTQNHSQPGSDIGGDDSAPCVEIAIASDANHLFIETTINTHLSFAHRAISQIHSNPFHEVRDSNGGNGVDGERNCRVTWYEPTGHDCKCCADRRHPNMCKSLIIARLLHSTRLVDPTVIFVGDGENDYCPVLNILRPRDCMLARRNFSIHHALSDQRNVGGCCRIGLWSNAKELLACLREVMKPAARLPVLARFCDVGPREFRSVTLSTRMPQVLTRTLAANASHVTETGRQLAESLIENTKQNGTVPPLPGQTVVPPWLQAYAAVPEFGYASDWKRENGDMSTAPKWGQLPWLQGEIYFYHLLAQYMLIGMEPSEHLPDSDGELMPNFVTPYAVCTSVKTLDSPVAPDAVVSAGGCNPLQFINFSILADNAKPNGATLGVADSVLLHDKTMDYRELMGGDSLVAKRGFFQPYRDFFAQEKSEVLRNFLRSKIIPMVGCVPWETSKEFVGVLLRWMLWGNAVDLSMFTLEELRASSGPEGESYTFRKSGIEEFRAAELERAMRQDEHIVGNQLAEVEKVVCNIIRDEPAASMGSGGGRTVNIVMDNAGVECVADLIFTLWLLHHHPSLRVILHVKSMPYYVSDVTSPDISSLLHVMEECSRESAGLSMVLQPFVNLVRDGLHSGRICIDADPFWVQPCEYREMPPHICNSFFFTQRVLSPDELKAQHPSDRCWPFGCRVYMARSALLIFKGDLNFRRLIGDRHWDERAFMSTLTPAERAANPMVPKLLMDTSCQCETSQDGVRSTGSASFKEIVSGFWPVEAVPVCAIRTMKSEVCVGVAPDRQDKLDQHDPKWRTSGSYGVILLASSDRPQCS